MKLSQLLETLTSNNIQLTLADLDTNAEIVTMQAKGWASLDDTIENREVKQWFIVSATHIKVVLGAVVDSTNTDPSNDPNADPNTDPSNP